MDKMQEALDASQTMMRLKNVLTRLCYEFGEDAFKAGYRAAKSESPWIPIADIPEEWKDGREVWLFFINHAVATPISSDADFWEQFRRILEVFPEYCCWQKANWSCHNEGGWVWNNMSGTPYFAMLPPSPPKEE